MKHKKKWIGGLAIAVAGMAWWVLPGAASSGEVAATAAKGGTASVKKGPLRVTITTNGSLKAKKSTQIRSEIKSQGKITFLIPEGTAVKEGDLLVEMDKTEQQKQADQLDMNKIQYESEFASAKTEIELQKTENQGAIEKAALKFEFAKLNLEKYRDGESPQEKRKLQLAVEKAISEEGRARERYESMPQLLKEGFVTKVEVEEERIKHEQAKIEVQSTKLALDLFEKYSFPMTLRQKQTDVSDAQRDMEREQQRATSRNQQKEAILSQKERQLKSCVDQLERTKEEISKMTIKSPGVGLVVYGDPDEGWWNSDRLKVGGNVWGNQIIMTLPDLSEMQVLVKVHETEITKLALDQAVTVTCDTYPGRIFTGKLTKIAALARQDGWGDEAVKKFPVEVTLDGKDHGLKPGVSAKCEILVETLPEVKFVPLQAVFVDAGKHHCFTASAAGFSRREVKLGKNNDNFIVIEEGLDEGENIALFNPETGEGAAKENDKATAGEKNETTNAAAPPAKSQ